MRRILEVVGHLHRQRAARCQHLGKAGEQNLVIAHPLKSGVAGDEVERFIRPPRSNVGLYEI
jgi:hypothetical protein